MQTHILFIDKEGDEFVLPIASIEMYIFHTVEENVDVENFLINGYAVYESEYNRVYDLLENESFILI